MSQKLNDESSLLISGENFLDIPTLTCKFIIYGENLIFSSTGIFVSSSTIKCRQPNFTVPGIYNVYISNNGETFSKSKLSLKVLSQFTLQQISPSFAPSTGGTMVTIKGTGFNLGNNTAYSSLCWFDDVSSVAVVLSDTEIVCQVPSRLGAFYGYVVVSVSQGDDRTAFLPKKETFYIYEAPVIKRIEPKFASTLGGTNLKVYTQSLPSLVNILNQKLTRPICKFGSSNAVEGSYDESHIADTLVVACPVPPTQNPLKVLLTLSLNGGIDFTDPLDSMYFHYHLPLSVNSVLPSIISTSKVSYDNGVQLSVAGENIQNLPGLQCVFDYLGEGITLYKEATWLSVSAVSCFAPPSFTPTTAAVFLSYNGDELSHSTAILTYQRKRSLTSVAPSRVSRLGGSQVSVHGGGFVSGFTWNIKLFDQEFNETIAIVPASFANDTCLLFTMPYISFDMTLSSSLQVYLSLPNNQIISGDTPLLLGLADPIFLSDIIPTHGSRQGGTNVRVTISESGINAEESAELSYECKFGEDSVSAAKVRREVDLLVLSCVAPPLEETVEESTVNLSIIRSDGLSTSNKDGEYRTYTYIALPSPVEISPSWAPANSEVKVDIFGEGFSELPRGNNYFCKFGKDNPDSAVRLNDTAIQCTTPVHSNVSVVEVSVSNNGIDWVTSPEKFSFVPELSVSSIAPKVGPISGNTTVELKGEGFMVSSGHFLEGRRWNELNIYCKFGAYEVSAVVKSQSTIECKTPSFYGIGTVETKVVLRVPHTKKRIMIAQSSNPLYFTFTPEIRINSIFPKSGVAGAQLMIEGSGFVDTVEGLSVIFTGISPNKERFSLTAVPHSVVNSSTLLVDIPTCPHTLNCQGNAEVTVSNNGGKNVAIDPPIRFYYYFWPD